VTHTYRNPWAAPHEPQEYRRDVEPIEYEGCLIFRVTKAQFDVVKNGVCIAQRGGLDGAKLASEVVMDMDNATFADVRDLMLLKYGHV
jgi:hypothetical protein